MAADGHRLASTPGSAALAGWRRSVEGSRTRSMRASTVSRRRCRTPGRQTGEGEDHTERTIMVKSVTSIGAESHRQGVAPQPITITRSHQVVHVCIRSRNHLNSVISRPTSLVGHEESVISHQLSAITSARPPGKWLCNVSAQRRSQRRRSRLAFWQMAARGSASTKGTYLHGSGRHSALRTALTGAVGGAVGVAVERGV